MLFRSKLKITREKQYMWLDVDRGTGINDWNTDDTDATDEHRINADYQIDLCKYPEKIGQVV